MAQGYLPVQYTADTPDIRPMCTSVRLTRQGAPILRLAPSHVPLRCLFLKGGQGKACGRTAGRFETTAGQLTSQSAPGALPLAGAGTREFFRVR